MYHITEEGPKPCKARVRACPIGGEHFESYSQAEEEFQKKKPLFSRIVPADDRIVRAYHLVLSNLRGGTRYDRKQLALKLTAERYHLPISELKALTEAKDKISSLEKPTFINAEKITEINDPNVSSTERGLFVYDPSSEVRKALAKSDLIDDDSAYILKYDKREDVRISLAGNVWIPEELLMDLWKNDLSHNVREKARGTLLKKSSGLRV